MTVPGFPKALCQVTLSGLDYERIEYSINRLPCYKIWIVENDASIAKADKALIVEIHNDLERRLRNRFQKNLQFCQVNFQNPREATLGMYAVILREQRRGFDVFVNISTGTKPMAVAATVAAALAGCSVVYFRAKEYSRLKDKDEVVAKGVKADPSPIEIPIFHLLRPATQMREERLEVLTELVRVGKISNVKDLTLNRKRNLRGASLDAEHARLLYHLHELEKDALVKVERQIESKSNGKPTKLKEETKPTDLGKFIVELKRIENEVNREPVPNPD